MKQMSQVLCGAAIVLMAAPYPLSTRVRCSLIPCKGKRQSRRMRIGQPVMIGLSFRAATIPRLCIRLSEA